VLHRVIHRPYTDGTTSAPKNARRCPPQGDHTPRIWQPNNEADPLIQDQRWRLSLWDRCPPDTDPRLVAHRDCPPGGPHFIQDIGDLVNIAKATAKHLLLAATMFMAIMVCLVLLLMQAATTLLFTALMTYINS
jgi:hypothetical protein